ncbi:glycosyltransferase [Paenibacillus flagellatus]|nr:glycosyltransferase [Paenibacillus flagellatus]
MRTGKLTAMMLVRNEADRYLTQTLDDLNRYVDAFVIVDDASTDRTVEICASYDKVEKLIALKEHGFHNEVQLRKLCWRETTATDAEWILALDADEIFEERMKTEIDGLLRREDVDAWAFPLYDFWGSTEYYRSDRLWRAHEHHGVFLLRNKPFEEQWRETPVHCGRIPSNVMQTFRVEKSDIRLKHYGWANRNEHAAKFERYMKADGEGKYGSLEQYYSILDPNPNLVKWEERHVR